MEQAQENILFLLVMGHHGCEPRDPSSSPMVLIRINMQLTCREKQKQTRRHKERERQIDSDTETNLYLSPGYSLALSVFYWKPINSSLIFLKLIGSLSLKTEKLLTTI